MPTQLTREQIIKRALDLRTNHAIDVVKLANDIGIQVYSTKKIEQSGQIKYDADTGHICIYVNETEPITRQRFSIAHELAHFVLHPEQLMSTGSLNRDKAKQYSSEMEKQADTLAAQILMPEELVTDFIKQANMDTTDIDREEVISIANTFKVSNFVAVMRLREMDYHVPFLDFA